MSWFPIGLEILLKARRESFHDVTPETIERAPLPCVFQKFTNTRTIAMCHLVKMEEEAREGTIADTIGQMYTGHYWNMAKYLEHGTGETIPGDPPHSMIAGWKTQVGDDVQLELERCTLWIAHYFLDLRTDYRWDYEAMTFQLRSIIGLEVKP